MKVSPQWVLYIAMLSVGMGQSIIFAVLPMLGRELKLHELQLQLPFLNLSIEPKELAITSLSALTALTFSLVSPFWGRMSDRYGCKPVIVVGLLGYTLGMALFSGVAYAGLVGAIGGLGLYILLLVARIIHASVMSAAFPASSAYMVGLVDANNRAKGLGKLSAANQLGIMCGPALAYLIALNYLAPFFVQSLITLFAAILVALMLPKTDVVEKSLQQPKKLTYWDKRYRVYIGVGLVVYTCLGMVQQTLGFFFQDTLNLDGVTAAKYYSSAMVVSSGAMMFAQLFLVQRLHWRPQILLRFGLPFMMFGFVLVAVSSNLPLLLIGMALFGFGMGFTGPGFSACASLTVAPNEQGALAGLVGAVAGMGFVIGPLLGGFLYALDSSYPYALAGACSGIVFIVISLRSLPGEFLSEE